MHNVAADSIQATRRRASHADALPRVSPTSSAATDSAASDPGRHHIAGSSPVTLGRRRTVSEATGIARSLPVQPPIITTPPPDATRQGGEADADALESPAGVPHAGAAAPRGVGALGEASASQRVSPRDSSASELVGAAAVPSSSTPPADGGVAVVVGGVGAPAGSDSFTAAPPNFRRRKRVRRPTSIGLDPLATLKAAGDTDEMTSGSDSDVEVDDTEGVDVMEHALTWIEENDAEGEGDDED